jgi:hypothetical protein
MLRLIVFYPMIFIQLLDSRQLITIRRNLSAELIRVGEVSGAFVDFLLVVEVVLVVAVNDGYFFSKSCCLIEPKRTNTGVLVFVVVGGTVGTFRSIDKRGLVVAIGLAAKARKGPNGRVGFVVTSSIDDRGLRTKLVAELADEGRLVSRDDVRLGKVIFDVIKTESFILPLYRTSSFGRILCIGGIEYFFFKSITFIFEF